MKKKYLLMAAAGVLVLSTMIGGTMAALNTSTENGAGAASVEVSVKEIGVGIRGNGQESEVKIPDAVPGEEVSYPAFVTNDTAEGYSIYAKVVLNKYWTELSTMEREGEYADLPADEFATVFVSDGTDVSQKTEIPKVSGTDGQVKINDWLITYADDEQIVMYYTKPLEAGEKSENFMDSISFSNQMGNDYTDKEYHIGITVTAVQTASGEDAIAAELGVFPVIDENGIITEIRETR